MFVLLYLFVHMSMQQQHTDIQVPLFIERVTNLAKEAGLTPCDLQWVEGGGEEEGEDACGGGCWGRDGLTEAHMLFVAPSSPISSTPSA